MNRDLKNTKQRATSLIRQFSLQRKKSVIALALVVIMIFMWIRLLRGKSPQTAGATIMPSNIATEFNPSKNLKITFIKLPSIEGRHDILHRDVFQMDTDIFGAGRKTFVQVDGAGGAIQRVVNMLRLDAISMGAEPAAFINDKIVKVGQKVNVRDGDKQYECEVTKIQANVVTVKIEDTEVELKLKEVQDFSEQ